MKTTVTEINVTETEKTEIVRHIRRRITIHGARNLADVQRILAEHGITDIDLTGLNPTGDAHRSRRPR